MKTISQQTPSSDLRQWHVFDASGKTLGRLATDVVRILTGKGKRQYTPHVDGGDFALIINAEGVRMTGNSKLTQKIDFRHSGYPGGDRMTPYSQFLKQNPERAISLAISGMLPKNRLRSRRLKRLKVYRTAVHPHGAQLAGQSQTATKEKSV